MFAKSVAFDQEGEALRKENYRLVVQVYNISMKEKAEKVLERIERGKIYEKISENDYLNSLMSILTKI